MPSYSIVYTGGQGAAHLLAKLNYLFFAEFVQKWRALRSGLTMLNIINVFIYFVTFHDYSLYVK
jgi:hypothetical protein